MCSGRKTASVELGPNRVGRARLMKLPKIKTLNRQIDVIETNSTESSARLAKIEKLLERIAEQLERKPG